MSLPGGLMSMPSTNKVTSRVQTLEGVDRDWDLLFLTSFLASVVGQRMGKGNKIVLLSEG